ncbi:phytanoyl-CoA dioxygenase family protein [Roseomonas elaeocarpi]|uniref:Phytanoyl-CoA dioxygenase family protein n=1 Tax=Roseomonas elaeocarpi TaxID=907779 RepID=A0ABV6JTI6_9PROT
MTAALSPARWLLLPWHAAQILTGRKSFAGNQILGSETLNRRGLHVWRTRLAHALADRRRARLAHLVSEGDREDFRRDGFVCRPDFLPPDRFQALTEQLAALAVPAREMREGDAVTRRIAVTPALLRQAPALRDLLESPTWRGLTRYVGSFDTEPMVYIQTIFAKADPGSAEDPQTSLHIDTFHPTMKAWFFLHDVADDEGPLTYVAGSHRLTPRRLAWQKRRSVEATRAGAGSKGGAFRLDARELPRLRWPAARRFAVRGNTLVVGDTGGLHARAYSPKATVRVEIYAYSRPAPFNPLTRSGPYSIPAIGRRQVGVYYALHDLLVPLRLMRRTWRRTPPVSPTAPRPEWD